MRAVKRQMSEAVAREDYAMAARLKKELQEMEANDPVTNIRQQLEAAVAKEQYQEAARLQQLLRKAEQEAAGFKGDFDDLAVTSDTVTEGVRVKVQSFFVPAQSAPAHDQYFFAYRVAIINEGTAVVHLRARHWRITDAKGRVEEVRGPGVVGEQPVLPPGERFEYTSGSPLTTPVGMMEGSYSMAVLDDEGSHVSTIEVAIGRFKLDKDAVAAI